MLNAKEKPISKDHMWYRSIYDILEKMKLCYCRTDWWLPA